MVLLSNGLSHPIIRVFKQTEAGGVGRVVNNLATN
jgi:hypothetical protein